MNPLLSRISILACLAAQVLTAPAQNPEQTTSSLSSGQTQSSSANYTLDGAVDTSAGVVASSANYLLKGGFVGQLYDAVSLQVTPTQASVNEGANNQLTATALMDDDTTLAPAPTEVTWSLVSGPVGQITPGGLAKTSPVFEESEATVRGSWRNLNGDGQFAVLDSDSDNVAPVAGDGIDDWWQFGNFDDDRNDALDFAEAARAGPGADGDRDQQNNLFEFLSGHDPNDPRSFLSWRIVDKDQDSATVRLSKVVPGTRYTLLGSTDLDQADPWTALLAPVEPAAEEVDHDTVVNGVHPTKQFFRWELEQAPSAPGPRPR